jgi:hypothetical protein
MVLIRGLHFDVDVHFRRVRDLFVGLGLENANGDLIVVVIVIVVVFVAASNTSGQAHGQCQEKQIFDELHGLVVFYDEN